MSFGSLVGRTVLVSAVAVALVPVLGAGPAFACSCDAGTDREHYARADVVFEGTLRGTRQPTQEQLDRFGSGAPEVFEFLPSRAYKGTVASPQRIYTAVDGETCGLEIEGPGPFLVFASKPTGEAREMRGPDTPELHASLCGGTRELKANEKVPFGAGRAVKSAPPAPAAPEPRIARAQSAIPGELALPAVAGPLGLTLGAAAWATRTNPTPTRRRP